MEAFKKTRHKRLLALLQAVFTTESWCVWGGGGVCVCSVCVPFYWGCVGATEERQNAEMNAWDADWWRLQSCLFQVIEVWHARPGWASKAEPILAPLDAYLFWVGVAISPTQGRRVPAGLQLSRQWIGCLSALELGCADPWVTPAFRVTPLSRGWVRQWLVAHIRGCRLVGGGRWEVQQLAQWLEWLTLKNNPSIKPNNSNQHILDVTYYFCVETHWSVRIRQFLRWPVLIPVSFLVLVSAVVSSSVAAGLMTWGPGGLLDDRIHTFVSSLSNRMKKMFGFL